jgi:hypothetical protein
VLWGAFHRPAGPNFALLALAAQRTPVLDGFITDVVGAEFWWRATQQGIKGPGRRVPRTYSEQELEPFLEAFKETGVVAAESDGKIVAAGWTTGVEETVAWAHTHATDASMLFVDALLVVLNADKQRSCEKQVRQRYGRWKVSANSTNLASPRLAGRRATIIAPARPTQRPNA